MQYDIKTITDLRKKFLEETIAYYSADTNRRATIKGSCAYNIKNKKCAIGRHIPDECYNPIIENKSAKHTDVMARIKLEVLCLGKEFLNDVQSLHDINASWNDEGMTPFGKSRIDAVLYWHVEVPLADAKLGDNL